MFDSFPKKTLIFIILFFISSCQIDQSLNEIRDSLADLYTNKDEVDISQSDSKDKKIINDLEKTILSSEDDVEETFKPPTSDVNNNNIIERSTIYESDEKNEEVMLATVEPISPKKTTNQLLGLLVPLSGEKKSAGDMVVKTLRFAIMQNNLDIDFKVFDTKGTPEGVKSAINTAAKQGLKIFLGPIFSYETKKVKESFRKNKLMFFSLSTDINNSSKNIIIAGQNSEQQVNCIYNDAQKKGLKKLLLIYQNNIYGNLIKDSLIEQNIKESKETKLDLDFFTVNKKEDLNLQIRDLSQFDNRKLELKEHVNNIIDSDEQDFEKKKKLKELERKLTLGSPFDTVIIASEGNELLEIVSHLAFYDIHPKNTVFYGTSLWEDSDKNDQIYNESLFLSNINERDPEFENLYNSTFGENPQSITFRIYDLINLINSFMLSEKKYRNNKLYYGKFANSYLENGRLYREIFVKKVKNKKDINLYRCSSNVF